MAQPVAYDREYNFTNYQSNNPNEPLPAPHVDAEYNRIKRTLDQILARLVLIQRDDGQLKNLIVTYDSLSLQVRALLGNIGILPETLARMPVIEVTEDFEITDEQNACLLVINAVIPVTISVPNNLSEGMYALAVQAGEAPFEFAPSDGQTTLCNKYGWYASEGQYAMLSLVVMANSDAEHANVIISGDVSP